MILKYEIYHKVCEFIRNYTGLQLDCDQQLHVEFPDIPARTLSAILSRELQNRQIANHQKLNQKSLILLKEYEKQLKENEQSSDRVLLDMSVHYKFSPLGLARILLNEKYRNCERSEISEMLRNPDLIADTMLAANTGFCLFNDNQEGILTDAIRKCVGEEYELKLKELAKNSGLEFYDEGDLRRTGYDKTPDLKLAIPCLYKGKVIHWIESKALFGDLTVHQRYIRDQLVSYSNRFGAGLVIYWFGYLDIILNCSENGQNIFITDNFPDEKDLEILKFDHSTVKCKTLN